MHLLILRNTNRVNTSSIQIGNEFYLVLISLKLIEKLSVTVGCCSSFDHYLNLLLTLIMHFVSSKVLIKAQKL